MKGKFIIRLILLPEQWPAETNCHFAYAMDKAGDTTNYVASRQAQNPLPALDAGQMKEAERLYLVNCGVCHGSKLDGNGPLWKDGSGPFTSAPKNLMTLDMPEGQMFYSITYGKNMMGSLCFADNR